MSRYVNQVRKARSKLRRALVEAQDNRCAYCCDQMDPAFPYSPNAATLEHVFPRRHGGTDATCVVVHSRCNHTKRARRPNGCELLALAVVRLRVIRSARLTLLVSNALDTLSRAPAWAGSRLHVCDCAECRALDLKFPDEGRQLLLPMAIR